MAHLFIEVGTLQVLELLLNGGVSGGIKLVTGSSRGRVLGLNGLTLIINTTTVTFSDPTGAGLTFPAIQAAIQGAVSGVKAVFWDERLTLKHATGVTVDKDGTANPIFGFDSAKDTVGVVYNPPSGAAPRVFSVGAGVRLDSYFAHVEVP